jgi:hypothetical protein
MQNNIVTTTVTPSAAAVLGTAINLSGNIAGAGEYVKGIIVHPNDTADYPASIVVRGECFALVDGDSVDVAVEDYLKSDASGHLVKATAYGTHTSDTEEAHIVALEANTGAAALKKVLVK